MEINKDIPLTVFLELGRTKKTIRELLNVSKGTVYRLEDSELDIIYIRIGKNRVGKGKILARDGKIFVEIVELIEG